MANANPGKTLDDLVINQAVNQLVHDAIVIWGHLSDDNRQHLSGALHSRFGISRERAQDYLDRAALQHGLRRD